MRDFLAPENKLDYSSTTASRTTENQRAFKDKPHKGKPSNFGLTVNAHWSEQALVTFVEAPQKWFVGRFPRTATMYRSSPAYRPQAGLELFSAS